jgi:glycosyltransferase involved in cell wall biosynthesis
MHVAMDAVPLIGERTGVGRYAHELLRALLDRPDAPEVTLTTLSARRPAHPDVPTGATWRHRRVPSRLVERVWDHGWVPAELLVGPADVFHATNFTAPPFRRTPVVASIHDLSFERFPRAVDANVARYRRRVPATLRRGALVLTLCEAVADEVIGRYGVERERVTAIAPGVGAAWAAGRPPSETWLASRALPSAYVLYVGSTGGRKNPRLLVESVRRARSLDGDVPPLVLAGPPPAVELAAAVQATGGYVAGFVADAELPNLVAGAACVVLPSMYEGFGLPLVEAMAAGTAVVASDIPAHREASGGLATLVPLAGTAAAVAGDAPVDAPTADAFAAAIVDAVRHGSAGRDERRGWAAQFTWERTASQTLAVYARAAGSR